MTTLVTDEQWLADWFHWHAAREATVLAPHGIAANTGTTWLSGEPQVIAGLPGSWIARDGRAVELVHDLVLAPGQEHRSGEKLVKVLAPRPRTVAVRVYDPAAPGRVDLEGIDAFAPDPAWLVRGDFEPADPGSSIAITHFDGVTTDDRLAGTVHVDVGGHRLQLVAWPSAEPGWLELSFADATNGVSTAQFRFVRFAAPASGGPVELDLNRAYLPPCAFGVGYLCPIPPAANRLPFGVDAGEKSPRR